MWDVGDWGPNLVQRQSGAAVLRCGGLQFACPGFESSGCNLGAGAMAIQGRHIL